MAVTMLRSREGLVAYRDIGNIPEKPLTRTEAKWVGATPTPEPGRFHDVNVVIAESGYAVRTDLQEPPWRFVAIHGRHAHHFASAVFGRKHTLSVFQRTDAETVITFCARNRREPWIEGILTIGPDTSLVSVSWSTNTPSPVRTAGGEITFGAWAGEGDDLPHLMPLRSAFWQQHPKSSDRYEYHYAVFVDWDVRPTDAW